MPKIELSDADKAAALAAWNAEANDPSQKHDPQHTANCMYAVYAAGIERAAKIADSYEPICDRCPQGCAAAVRALLK